MNIEFLVSESRSDFIIFLECVAVICKVARAFIANWFYKWTVISYTRSLEFWASLEGSRNIWTFIKKVWNAITILITVWDILRAIRAGFSRINDSISTGSVLISLVYTEILEILRAIFTGFSLVNFPIPAKGLLRIEKGTRKRTFPIFSIVRFIIALFSSLSLNLSISAGNFFTNFNILRTIRTSFCRFNFTISAKGGTGSYIFRTAFTGFS